MTTVWGSSATDALLTGTQTPILDGSVIQRISKLKDPVDAQDSLGARALTAQCVASVAGVPAHSVHLRQLCASCGSDDHGPPKVVGIPSVTVSWSHSRGHVAAAASSGAVAIDVERSRDVVLRQVLTNDEWDWVSGHRDQARAFARLWCRKECMVKLGHTSLDRLTDVSFVTCGILSPHASGWIVTERSMCDAVVVLLSRDYPVRITLPLDAAKRGT